MARRQYALIPLILFVFCGCQAVMEPVLPSSVEAQSSLAGIIRRLFLEIRGEQELESETVVVVAAKAATLEGTPPASPVPAPIPAPVSEEAPPTPETCSPAPMLPVKVCEPGAGFLCVHTPAGGVVKDHVVVRGFVDGAGHAFSGMKVVVQHDATRMVQEVSTQDASTTESGDPRSGWTTKHPKAEPQGTMDCAIASLAVSQPFCLEASGAFAARIPLTQLGTYTIGVQAFRAGNDPMVETVRVSRVIAPTMTAASVTLDPDPQKNGGRIAADQVMVQIDLLPDCEQCDLIGGATGATSLTATDNSRAPPVDNRPPDTPGCWSPRGA